MTVPAPSSALTHRRLARLCSALLALAAAATAAPASPAVQAAQAAQAAQAEQAAQADCGAALVRPQRLQGTRHVLAFAPQPAPWATGRPVAVDMVVCPKGDAPMPDSVRVDARMPQHGHGMNYRPSITSPAPGRWRAEGLMLHMAGRWELSFELNFELPQGRQVERLTQELQLR